MLSLLLIDGNGGGIGNPQLRVELRSIGVGLLCMWVTLCWWQTQGWS